MSTSREAKQAAVPSPHPASGLQFIDCPKCGEKTQGLYNSADPKSRALIAQPHIRGNWEWCYPQGIPTGLRGQKLASTTPP